MTYSLTTTQLTVIILLVIWDLVWRGIALWRSSQRKDIYWFIALLIFNTAAILPIIYLTLIDLNSSPNKSSRRLSQI